MKRVMLSHNPFHIFSHSTTNRKPTVRETRIIHAQILKTPILQWDLFVANSLADSYCKSGSMTDALMLFDDIPIPSITSWNIIIFGYNKNFQFGDSLRVFGRLRSSGTQPDKITYGSVISACCASNSLCFSKQIYSLVTKNGLFSDRYVSTGMIDLFTKNCCFEDAMKVFSEGPIENVVCWNAMISGCVKNRENWMALDLFLQMVDGFSVPDDFTFSSVLTACTTLGELETGRGIHGHVIKYGLQYDIFVGTAVVDLYAKLGNINEATKQFTRMPSRNVVSWTAIISGFVQKEDSINALRFFKQMKEMGEDINNYTITSVLTACAKPAMAREALQIHCLTLKSVFSLDSTVKDTLINMYSKIGKVVSAEKVFEEMGLVENVYSWAVMISGFAQNERSGLAIGLFQRMFKGGLRPDKFCTSSVLSITSNIDFGQQIHSYTVKAGLLLEISVASALFTMYSKCGFIGEAYEVFEKMPEKDAVSWTSMVAGFAEHGHANEAFRLFRQMVLEGIQLDQTTLAAILMACSTCQSLRKGKEAHGYTLRVGLWSDVVVGGALVNMYSKCRTLVSARKIFDAMPRKDQVAWSSMVSGYVQNAYTEVSLLLFHQMLSSGMEIDCCTISSILGMLGNLTRPSLGKQIHSHSVKTGLDLDQNVSSSLVTMYSKCGSIEDSRRVFDQIPKPDLVTWTAMITGYAQHGQGLEALKIYEMMRKKGSKPDSVTFVGVLSACSHNGLVDEGYVYLHSMVKDYGIEPELRHYACMVDLLCRAGRLQEAKRFIASLPIEPDALVWGTLLGACKVHGNLDLGRLAAEKVLELDPSDHGTYVSLSNIYADLGDWEKVAEIRSLMKGAEVKKEPGCSFV